MRVSQFVVPAHGSGVGSGLIAAKILSEKIISHSDPGSVEATWSYQSAFQKDRGAIHAFYEIFTRMSQLFNEGEVNEFISWLMPASALEASFHQQMPHILSLDLIPSFFSSISKPYLASKIITNLPKMLAVYLSYSKYPQNPDLSQLKVWSKISSFCGGF